MKIRITSLEKEEIHKSAEKRIRQSIKSNIQLMPLRSYK
jgi:hypothetical protein